VALNKEERMNYIKRVFLKVKENDQRLAKGFALRKQMIKALKEGQTPTGYRPEWIKKSSQKVIQLLKSIAYDFNFQHEDDKTSVLDMVDILNSAVSYLKKR